MISEITFKPYSTFCKEEIVELYKSVGWDVYLQDLDRLKQAFDHSLFILTAYQKQRLVGLIRVVGDGYTILYIQDLLVHPDFARQGIGSRLLLRILSKYESVYQKILLTDDQVVCREFYEKMGFIKSSELGCLSYQWYQK